MNEEICKVKYTSEEAGSFVGETDFWDEFYNPERVVENDNDVKRLMSQFHFYKDIKSGFFDSKLIGKECVKCSKIIKLTNEND